MEYITGTQPSRTKDSKYVICRTGHDLHDSTTAWQQCNSLTLRGAKMEATRILGHSYLHHVLHIGYLDTSGQVQELAHRMILADHWTETT